MKVLGFISFQIHTAHCGVEEGGPCGAAVYRKLVVGTNSGKKFLTDIAARSGNFSSVYAIPEEEVWRRIRWSWRVLEDLGLSEEAEKVIEDRNKELAFRGLHGEESGNLSLFGLPEIKDPRVYGVPE